LTSGQAICVTSAITVGPHTLTASYTGAANYGASESASYTWEVIAAPTLTTQAATWVSNTAATLNGLVNANGSSATVTFEYGADTSYGNTVTAQASPVSGTSATPVTANLTGLAPNTTYHFRVVAVNAAGTTYGADQVFTTGQYRIFCPFIKR
jgi:phosphodiesterase/alkaline phosphatase D-like protein